MLGRLFIRVLAITVGVTLSVGLVGGGIWWYIDNRKPNIQVEFRNFGRHDYEGTEYFNLNFTFHNHDSSNYRASDFELGLVTSDGAIFDVGGISRPTDSHTLISGERVVIIVKTKFSTPEGMVSTADLDFNTVAGVEGHIENLEKFKEKIHWEGVILVSEQLKIRHKVSFSDYYEEELKRWEEVLSKIKSKNL